MSSSDHPGIWLDIDSLFIILIICSQIKKLTVFFLKYLKIKLRNAGTGLELLTKDMGEFHLGVNTLELIDYYIVGNMEKSKNG